MIDKHGNISNNAVRKTVKKYTNRFRNAGNLIYLIFLSRKHIHYIFGYKFVWFLYLAGKIVKFNSFEYSNGNVKDIA